MKFFAAAALFFLFVIEGVAQPKAGDFMLGGSLGFSNQRGQSPDNSGQGISNKTSLNFSPQVGFFINKRFATGFSASLSYSSTSYAYKLLDTNNHEVKFKDQFFSLSFGFGIFGSYYLPIAPNLYMVNTLDARMGNYIQGDRLASLFSESRPQQDRSNFYEASYILGLQYFMKPNVALSVGFTPLAYNYNTSKIVRTGQPSSSRNGHTLQLPGQARGFFIGINYLIISENNDE